jgi:hypothetical protein
MTKQLIVLVLLLLSFLILQITFVGDINAQWASTPSGDFGAVNHGDLIALQWDSEDAATQYFVYLASSSSGPWTLLFSVNDNTGGAKIHRTPDARTMDLCYKLEAKDATDTVIKTYEPICVPKYTG